MRVALRQVNAALRLSAAVLERDPDQLPAQLLARLSATSDPAVSRLLEGARRWDRRPWLRPLVPSLDRPGSPLVANLRGHQDDITAVAITADGRQAVSGSVPRAVKHWDLDRGTERQTLRGYGRHGPGEGYGDAVTTIAIAPDGHQVASADHDGTIHVWQLPEGTPLRSMGGEAGDDEDWACAISPRCGWAVSAFVRSIIPVVDTDKRGTIRVHDLTTGEEVHQRRDLHASFGDLAICDEGPMVVTASGGGLLRWDPGRGVEAVTRGLSGSTLAVTPDGRIAVTGHADGSLRVWELDSQAEPFVLTGHSASVGAVAITSDGAIAVSGSADASVRLWDLVGRSEIHRLSGHVGEVRAVAVTPDGHRVLSGGADRVLRVWDLRGAGAGATTQRERLPVDRLLVSADGRKVVAVSASGAQEVWDLDERPGGAGASGAMPEAPRTVAPELRARIEELERQVAGSASNVKVLAIDVTPDGRRAVCASQAYSVLSGHHRWGYDLSTVRVWDLSGEPVGRVLFERGVGTVGGQRGEFVRDVAVSEDGRYAAAVGDDGTVRAWELESLAPVGAFTADGPLQVCAIAADGSTVAAGGATGEVHLLRVTGEGRHAGSDENRPGR